MKKSSYAKALDLGAGGGDRGRSLRQCDDHEDRWVR